MKKARRVAGVLGAAWLAMAPLTAPALDPALAVSQYGHTAWRNRDGFAIPSPGPIAQTADGYLWFSTSSELFRFDGVRGVAWKPPAGSTVATDRVRVLLGAKDGSLWIGTIRGLASLKDGKLVAHEALEGATINAIVEHDGAIWVGGSDRNRMAILCAIRAGTHECHGQDGGLGRVVTALYGDSTGALWVAGMDRVWRWGPGATVSYTLPAVVANLKTVAETADGAILVGTVSGIVRIADGKVQPLAPAWPEMTGTAGSLLRDRDGAVWIGMTDLGIFHVHEGRRDRFTSADGLSGDNVGALFEDREGNVWATSRDGLDRFRPIAAVPYSRAQGVAGIVVAVLTARDGSRWISTSTGLYRVDRGDVTLTKGPRAATLFEDRGGRLWVGAMSAFGYMEGERFVGVAGVPPGYIESIVQDARGSLWIAHRDAGLLKLRPDGSVERAGPNEARVAQASILAVDPVDDGLWIGTREGELVHVLDGKVRASPVARDALRGRRISHIRADREGTLWVASDMGLYRIQRDRVSVLASSSGMPCDAVHWTSVDERSLWVYTACGLVEIAQKDLDAWTAAADRGAKHVVAVRLLGDVDGIRTRWTIGTFAPHATRGADGRIWMVTRDGAVVVDPARLPVNATPPPVRVEDVVADRTQYERTTQPLRLPALLRDLEIDYTALSLTLPEKNVFRFKLEGRDAAWQDAGNRRKAFYTDLPPGGYRFRVTAANNSGVWNGEGDSIAFSIAPAWWQTTAFRVSCVAGLALLLYGLYRLRIAQLGRELNRNLDVRVNERLRIARDLHDTLLQSFHGLLLRFQTAADLLPSRASEAKEVLAGAIDQAADAITEGREAVQGLRASASETNDLGEAIRAIGESLSVDHGQGHGVVVKVQVEGAPRRLHPILRDEVFRIASEALRNAFRHSGARRVEVDLHYDERQMRLRVRDDGRGMDPKVLALQGREGHFGLRGMRERASLVGGKVAVWSADGAGTEVELTIPARNAYSPRTPQPESAREDKVEDDR